MTGFANAGVGTWLAAAIAGVAVLWGLLRWSRGRDTGAQRFFRNQTCHFQTLRVFNDIPAGGADTGEILQAIRTIRSGDGQSWYTGWEAAATRAVALADRTKDLRSRGAALHRGHNYLRTAQFLLPPDDPKRPAAFERDRAAFYAGLHSLGVRHQVFGARLGAASLKCVYYPALHADAHKPLIVFFGGYDSTLEELYFVLVEAALRRGYEALTFEGPGQGAALREQGLIFTHEWEKPTGAVLDAFLALHPKPPSTVLVGMSMGGYLAPRAAAFDARIDGVVAFDVFFDMAASARRYVPPLAFWLHDHGMRAVVSWLVKAKQALDPDLAWVRANGEWVMGTRGPIETARAFDSYTLAGVAHRINCDVLILAGVRDHFVPLSQVHDFERALTNARSVTTCVYDDASGGAEHCQLGAVTLWHQDFFDWVAARFETPPLEWRSHQGSL